MNTTCHFFKDIFSKKKKKKQARPGPGPGPALAQKSNPKSIFLGICGISEASNRPVSIRLAELVCLLFSRGLRNPSGTKIDQKSFQEPSKMHPKSHLVFDHFLDGFRVHFWWFSTPKSTKKQSKINVKLYHFLNSFLDRFFIEFGSQDTSKIQPKSMINRS